MEIANFSSKLAMKLVLKLQLGFPTWPYEVEKTDAISIARSSTFIFPTSPLVTITKFLECLPNTLLGVIF